MSDNINVSPEEIAKFEQVANLWWDLEGEFKPLHQINPLRVQFITSYVDNLYGKSALDVGCGGGILSESLSKLGATVTGIDLGSEPLNVAKLHALETQLTINYQKVPVETLAVQSPASFDFITCMEMLEHVPNPASVIHACAALVKPGGLVFFSTLNKTIKAYLLAVLAAEKVLKIVPEGTHDHDKFIAPANLIGWAEEAGLKCLEATGIHYNPVNGNHTLGGSLDVNYIICCRKL